MAKTLKNSAPRVHAQGVTAEQFDAKANPPFFGSLLLVALFAIALTVIATVNPELGRTLSTGLLIFSNALVTVGIPYTGEFATGPLPSNVYVVIIAIAIWWAIFAAVLYAIQFIVVYRPLFNPSSYGHAVERRNNCSLYHSKIWVARCGLLVFWIVSVLFLTDAVTAFFPFHLNDGVVTVIWPLLVACCGPMLLWIPIAEVALLAYDCKTLWRWACSI